MVLVVLLLAVLVVPVDAVAKRRADASALIAAARGLPGPSGFRVVIDRDAPNPYYDENQGAIVAPSRLGRYERAHEAAHMLDHQALTDRDRDRFRRILGLERAWRSGVPAEGGHAVEGASARTGAEEMFADYYAHAVLGMDPRGRRGKDGVLRGSNVHAYVTPRPRRLRRFTNALERLAARRPELGPYR